MGHGEISLPVVVIALVAAASIYTDLRYRRVFNWVTLPAMALGIGYALFSGGPLGAGQALLGIAVGFLLLGWMFFLGILGGGDVKLLMAFGAWGGSAFTAKTAICSLALGALLAVLILLYRGKLLDFLSRMKGLLLSVFVPALRGTSDSWVDQKAKMPFAVPLSIAAVACAVSDPFLWLGRA